MPAYQNIANCDAFATVETGPVYKNMKLIWHLNNILSFVAFLQLHSTCMEIRPRSLLHEYYNLS